MATTLTPDNLFCSLFFLCKVFSPSPLVPISGSGSGGSNSSTGAVALKELGNELFGKGDIAGALRAYLEGIHKCCADKGSANNLSVLLSNRAQCNLNQRLFEAAVADAGAAVLLDPGSAKSHYRRSLALLNLHSFLQAEAACREGLEVAPEAKDISELLGRVTAARKSSMASFGEGHQKEWVSLSCSYVMSVF